MRVSSTIFMGWFLNMLLMFLAVKTLGDAKSETVRGIAWPLIMSWAPVSVFAGMGPSPETVGEQRFDFHQNGWASYATIGPVDPIGHLLN